MSLAGIIQKTQLCEIRAYLVTRSETDGSKSDFVPIECKEVIEVRHCPACGRHCKQSFFRYTHLPRKSCRVCTVS